MIIGMTIALQFLVTNIDAGRKASSTATTLTLECYRHKDPVTKKLPGACRS